MTAESELSPAMKIFLWRGPSCSDAANFDPEATVPSPAGFVPIITDTVTSSMYSTLDVEISLAGAMLRVASNINRALLTELLCAIRSSSPGGNSDLREHSEMDGN
jgi:hypothetical protein